MYSIGTRLTSRCNDFLHISVRFLYRTLANPNGFVGEIDVQTALVGRRVNRDRPNPHAPEGPLNTNSNGTAICYQNFLKQNQSLLSVRSHRGRGTFR
ncbi:hypothetical protein GCM10025858_31770 [Alicyclobacillus sacchari]|nr:hypothetical protein GCM10025858_31770 [Alicyclobacillus sacchari]